MKISLPERKRTQKKHLPFGKCFHQSGEDGIRTHDLLTASQAL